MRKIIYFLLLILCPIWVFAYSNYIIVGGDTLGIDVTSKGVVVVGLYKVNGDYLNKDIYVGDKIVKVKGVEVNTTNELVDNINKYMEDESVPITVVRNNEEMEIILNLSLYKDNYRTGLYVKGNVLGIGTLSYIDPETNIYGVLGHSLNISSTNEMIEIKEGDSYEADVTSFTRSSNGSPGSKNADIDKEEYFGTIDKNSSYGIFGFTKNNNKNDRLVLEVGTLDDIKIGMAYLYTTDINNKIDKYEIKILEIDKEAKDKNILFEIVDERLLKMSGGIVQGMSGSPIVQDGKIIGAVTRVLIDDVKKGYGISIVTMLEEGDKLLD